MMVLKRKEIVAASLVALIGVAGYLNWSYQDTAQVTDGEEYIATGKKLGEAQLVSKTETEEIETNSNAVDAGYFDSARQNRETSRQKSLDILNQSMGNENFDEETRQKAQERVLKIAEEVKQEAECENIIRAKSYPDAVVTIDEESCEVIVKKDGFCDTDAKIINEIVSTQLNISPACVKIVPVK